MAALARVLLLLILLPPGPALAAVEIAFYSRDADVRFPHAFVVLQGTVDATGEAVNEDYGFTAVTPSPAVLWGPVRGRIITDHPKAYVAGSRRHFSFVLSDAEYAGVMAVIERWRRLPQPSYALDTRNCLFFVADIAAALGLEADPPARLVRKPRSFLTWLTDRNRPLIQARTEPPAADVAGVSATPASGSR